MFSSHKDAARQRHLRDRIVALDDKVGNLFRPDLQLQGVDAKSRVAVTADGVVSEDQTDFEADVGSSDTSDEFNDTLSDEDDDFTGEAEERRPRNAIVAREAISPILITPRGDELDGDEDSYTESDRDSSNETDNDVDSDATEDED